MRSLETSSCLLQALSRLGNDELVMCFHNFTDSVEAGRDKLCEVIPVAGHFRWDSLVVSYYCMDYVFYSSREVTGAILSGTLCLAFGDLNSDLPCLNATVGCVVTRYLHEAGLTTTWDGTPTSKLQVHLQPEDLKLMHFFNGGASGIARFHRKQRVWRAMREGVRLARTERLHLCFQAWACRPALCMYRRAQMDFDHLR